MSFDSPKTCGKCPLWTEIHWLSDLPLVFQWLNFYCKDGVKSMSLLQKNSVLNSFSLWQLLTVFWLCFFVCFFFSTCHYPVCCSHIFCLSSLPLCFLGQLNSEFKSVEVLSCVIKIYEASENIYGPRYETQKETLII